MGARVPGREQGIDCDIYDAYCDHLLMLLPLSRTDVRYARHFLKAG
jgi:hypothetical protein